MTRGAGDSARARSERKGRKMTQFELAIAEPVTCDICGEVMHPMYGVGWDNDRLVCADLLCGAEIVYPTTTILPKTEEKGM